ncbi:MAG: glycosyltransferase family 2 protein [Gammaproteobacteria bacterium]|nr:glycosyltransferase family 2 protein [Gammaproteobacteria bacterium]
MTADLRYSIVIPVLNDREALAHLLDSLDAAGAGSERIVVDGGSSDRSGELARTRGCTVVGGERGRATQLARGIEHATGDWLWLLHADTEVSTQSVAALHAAIARPASRWGRFDVVLADRAVIFRLIGNLMNLRSRLTGICTGDQAIFVHATLLRAIGGMPIQALMEDIELSKRLKQVEPPQCLRATVTASARRWQSRGIVRTILLMWLLRLAYFIGVSPARLARAYYGG